MLVVMQQRATAEQIESVMSKVRELDLQPHPIPGSHRTAIGITGNTAAIDPSSLVGLAGVGELIRVTKPYKLASREMQQEDSQVQVGGVCFGPGSFPVIAGPCSIENEAMLMQTAEFLLQHNVSLLRAGAFKPRTSPYSFQGLEHEGLALLDKVRQATGIGIVTEVMDASQVAAVEEVADVLQIGTRNMQNFTLLKRISHSSTPVLLKRGMSATLEEWLMSAEYVMAGGNRNVILCERGIRTFADHTRNTLDLSVIPPLKELSHLPVIVDPSHATGRRTYVSPMARASLAAGADGLMIEIHPQPDQALSDGAQTLAFEPFVELLKSLEEIAPSQQRTLC